MNLIDMMQEFVQSLVVTENQEETKTYKADYEDENFEVISAESDIEAFEIAKSYEDEHGCLFNLFEVDDNYDEIREVTENQVEAKAEQNVIEHLENGGAVHCKTEEQAIKFLNVCDKYNIKWGSGRPATSTPNRWEDYKEYTCYALGAHNKLLVASRGFYEGKNISTFNGLLGIKDKSSIDILAINDLADKLVDLHALECKRSNHHCIYSDKIYSDSCIKCFTVWLLSTIKKRE